MYNGGKAYTDHLSRLRVQKEQGAIRFAADRLGAIEESTF